MVCVVSAPATVVRRAAGHGHKTTVTEPLGLLSLAGDDLAVSVHSVRCAEGTRGRVLLSIDLLAPGLTASERAVDRVARSGPHGAPLTNDVRPGRMPGAWMRSRRTSFARSAAASSWLSPTELGRSED